MERCVVLRPLAHFDGLIAARLYQSSTLRFEQALLRLGTGQRINRAADDPAKLVAAESLRAELARRDGETRGLERAIHVSAVADGALGQVAEMLIEARGLAVASAGMLSPGEREAIDIAWQGLRGSMQRVLDTTSFQGQRLFDGALTLEAAGASFTIAALGSGSVLPETLDDAGVRAAIARVNGERARLGAFARDTIGSRLESLRVEFENLAAAHSGIHDADYARETGELIRARLLGIASLRASALGLAMRRGVLRLLA